MSAKSGSARRKKEMGEVSLNLNPMMDMFAVLIPALNDKSMEEVVEAAAWGPDPSAPFTDGLQIPCI